MNENVRLYLLKTEDIQEIFYAVNEIPDEKIRNRVLDAINAATRQNEQRVTDFIGAIAKESIKAISADLLTTLTEK